MTSSTTTPPPDNTSHARRTRRPSRKWTTDQIQCIALLTIGVLAAIALIGGFITGQMQPFQGILTFLVGAFSGIFAGRASG